MDHYEKWSYYTDNDFIDKKTLTIEAEKGDLKLYHYFSTLQWQYSYAIVYKNIILREHQDEYPYDEWDMAVDLLSVLNKEEAE